VVYLVTVLAAVSAWASEPATPPPGPHGEIACSDCHPEGYESAAACLECHELDENLHPDAVLPTFAIPDVFPLREGRVTCTSCHRLHEPTGPRALRGFAEGLATELKGFCGACHGERLAGSNPHRADVGEDRCAFCHASLDVGAVLAGQTATARTGADRLCNFCHDVKSRDHPRNIDPVLDLPDDLPTGPGGEITCITCHHPHGSSRFTHYIREEYASHFERGRQDNPHVDDRAACPACHVGRGPENITPKTHELRFDAILLCISCHVTARGHHPVGTPLPETMEGRLREHGGLPLSAAGSTTCTTCHTNNCESDAQHMSVHHYDPERMRLDLCWMCHPREEFASVDPHRKTIDDTTEGCVFCHDRPPVKGLEQSAELYFISQIRMICLRCHEGLSDLDVSHTGVMPTPEIQTRLHQYTEETATPFPLDQDGTFTCTTCHNAHFSAQDEGAKTRIPTREMCPLCHEK
jgi:predicted CXXCH cytochrome family protein